MSKKGKKKTGKKRQVNNHKVINLFTANKQLDLIEDLFTQLEYVEDGVQQKKLLTRILELDPNNVDAKMMLIKADSMQDLIEQTRNLWATLKEEWQATERLGWYNTVERPYLRAWYHMADLYAKAGRLPEAISLFEDLLQSDPTDAQGVRFELMFFYCKAYRLTDAKRLWLQLGEERLDEQILIPYMITLLLHGEEQEAKQVFEQLVPLNYLALKYLVNWEATLNDLLDLEPDYIYSDISRIDPIQIAIFKLLPWIASNIYVFEFFGEAAEAYIDSHSFIDHKRELSLVSKGMQDFIAMHSNPIFEGVVYTARQALVKKGIKKIEDFLKYTEKEILAIKGIGPVTIKKLKENGIRFKA